MAGGDLNQPAWEVALHQGKVGILTSYYTYTLYHQLFIVLLTDGLHGRENDSELYFIVGR